MKHKLVFETTHKEFHRIIWDTVREVCHEYNVNLRADRKTTSNVDQIKLITELHANQKLRKNDEGEQRIIEL
jgi:hypothetical protein